MHNKIYLLFCFFGVLFLFQCQADKPIEQKPKTTAQYSIRYLEDEQKLRGQIAFYTGDSIETQSPLQIESGVTFVGRVMKERSLSNKLIRYEATFTGSLPHPINLSFKMANDETPKTVSFDMTLVGDFSVKSAHKENGLRLELSSPIMNDESLLLLFTDPNGEARTIIRPGPIEDMKLFIPSDALLHFVSGSYGVYLVKSKKVFTEKDNVDFQTSIEYYSKEVTFELRE